MKYPRVLVIANNCFSLSNSNGRTLGKLFEGWPLEKLAQFTLSIKDPDFEICNNYYCITDKEALSSIFYGASNIGKQLSSLEQVSSTNNRSKDKRVRKNAFKMLIRQMVWACGRWKNNAFKKWIEVFNPELVLIQSGDSPFMLQIAEEISQQRNIPLVFFNTEGYYFFKRYYTSISWSDYLPSCIFQKLYKSIFKRVLNKSAFSIYGNELLKEDYDKEFHKPSDVIYTSSELDFQPKKLDTVSPKFSYIGNLSFDRYKVLVEVADVLHEINPQYRLDIYGSARKEALELFKTSETINFKGFVSYTEVCEIMKNSDILFHVETQNPKYKEALKYGFSTKIADSIASGQNFILYSAPNIACARYIIKNQSAWFVSSRSELKNTIKSIMSNSQQKQEILGNARLVTSKNHNSEKNREKFFNILVEVVENSKK